MKCMLLLYLHACLGDDLCNDSLTLKQPMCLWWMCPGPMQLRHVWNCHRNGVFVWHGNCWHEPNMQLKTTRRNCPRILDKHFRCSLWSIILHVDIFVISWLVMYDLMAIEFILLLAHWGRDKMATNFPTDDIFGMHFLEWKCVNFD